MRLLAEYRDEPGLRRAIAALRGRAGLALEAYTPYPLHDVDAALGRGPSRLPIAVFVMGLAGAGGAYLLQWYLNAFLYPLNVGGRPPHMPVAYVPITFEMGVLLASITAFVAVLVAGRLVRLWDPVFDADGFESASETRFWLEVHATGPEPDRGGAEAELRDLGAIRVVSIAERLPRGEAHP